MSLTPSGSDRLGMPGSLAQRRLAGGPDGQLVALGVFNNGEAQAASVTLTPGGQALVMRRR